MIGSKIGVFWRNLRRSSWCGVFQKDHLPSIVLGASSRSQVVRKQVMVDKIEIVIWITGNERTLQQAASLRCTTSWLYKGYLTQVAINS